MPTDARAEIETRLRAVAARLVMRQAARAAFGALGGAAMALCFGLVFLDGLPRLLFNASAGMWPILTVGAAGLFVGAWWELRQFTLPSMQDAALAMEARLGNDTGALASILKLAPDSAFASPVTTRAREELREAESNPGPNVISTRRLILVPVLALLAGIGLGMAIVAEAPPVRSDNGTKAEVADNWSAVDVSGSRTVDDQKALQDALNMEKTAAKLSSAAATIRDASASTDERQAALDSANAEFTEMSGELSAGEALPATLPESETDRSSLADRIDEMASKAASSAKAVKDAVGGTSDSSGNGEYGATDRTALLVPFPAMKITMKTDLPAEALAAQTPARRALAARAVEALERIQNP